MHEVTPPIWPRCETSDRDAGQCQLRANHEHEHIASTGAVVFTWSAVEADFHVYSTDQLDGWIMQAPWIDGLGPAA